MRTAPVKPDQGQEPDPGLRLTEDHRMLLQIRDALYEGSWDDFVFDLRARAEGRPHVFITVPSLPEMKTAIFRHLDMIADMQRWEARHQRPLHANDTKPV